MEYEIHTRTFEDRGTERTVRYVLKECETCGGDVEVPVGQADADRESYCSLACSTEKADEEV